MRALVSYQNLLFFRIFSLPQILEHVVKCASLSTVCLFYRLFASNLFSSLHSFFRFLFAQIFTFFCMFSNSRSVSNQNEMRLTNLLSTICLSGAFSCVSLT